jgi:hypothetical protein
MSAMHFIAKAWRLKTPTTIKNYFVKRGFLFSHVSGRDGSAVKLTEVEEDDYCTLQTLGMHFEDYTVLQCF